MTFFLPIVTSLTYTLFIYLFTDSYVPFHLLNFFIFGKSFHSKNFHIKKILPQFFCNFIEFCHVGENQRFQNWGNSFAVKIELIITLHVHKFGP